MRYTKKRFTQSHTRDTSTRDRAILTRNGVSRFSQSQLGMSVRREQIMNRMQIQQSLCFHCLDRMDLDDAVFLTTEFPAGILPPLVHKRCRRKYEKEKAKTNDNDNDNVQSNS